MNFILVGIGGFLGAITRYVVGLTTLRYLSVGFPYATLIVNVTGSFCLGLLVAAGLKEVISERTLLFAGVGFLGAYTTFSTFSVEVLWLFKEGHHTYAVINILLNPIVAILAAFAGMKLLTT